MVVCGCVARAYASVFVCVSVLEYVCVLVFKCVFVFLSVYVFFNFCVCVFSVCVILVVF